MDTIVLAYSSTRFVSMGVPSSAFAVTRLAGRGGARVERRQFLHSHDHERQQGTRWICSAWSRILRQTSDALARSANEHLPRISSCESKSILRSTDPTAGEFPSDISIDDYCTCSASGRELHKSSECSLIFFALADFLASTHQLLGLQRGARSPTINATIAFESCRDRHRR